MEVKLEALKDVTFKNGYYESDFVTVRKGDVVQAKFSQFGIKFLFGNCWSFDFKYKDIEEQFKIYGQ